MARPWFALVFLVAVPIRSSPAQRPSVPVVVDAGWVQSRARDVDLAILHVAGSRAEYDAGHIPGARYLPYAGLIVSVNGLTTQAAPLAQLDSLLESVGVSDQHRVVVYGQPLFASRAFMTLEYLGLRGRVGVLNGGMDHWRESGRPVSSDPVTAVPATFTPRVVEDLIVDAAWIQAHTGKPGISLLDARAPEFYLGFSPGQMPRAGHIPGARNLPFGSLTTELTQLRDDGKVRKLFRDAMVASRDTVVTYCHIGMQASLLYLSARRLGFEAKLYDGSFEEWSKRADLPVTNKATGR
jgi:thiosulfate/3-mercaptopyruvate sulfurtransferase